MTSCGSNVYTNPNMEIISPSRNVLYLGIYIIIINNNNICLKSNIQTSSVDYAPRELTHACSRSETCSRSDTEACDMCYVF